MAVAVPFVLKTAGLYLVGRVLASLARPKSRTPLDSSKPAQLSERGSLVPLAVGSHRLAPVFMWEGFLVTRQEPIDGGSGGKGVGTRRGGQDNLVYFANGMLGFAAGPAERLRRILFDGKQVWPASFSGGPVDQDLGITRLNSESGSSYVLANNPDGKSYGSFRIYWGETDQPPCNPLTGPLALGTSANHGHIFYLYFENVRLGGPGVWPQVTVEADIKPYNVGQLYNNGSPSDYDALVHPLSGSEPWLANGLAINPAQCYRILNYNQANNAVTVGLPGPLPTFDPDGFRIEIRGNNPASNGRYFVNSTFEYGSPAVIPGALRGNQPYVYQWQDNMTLTNLDGDPDDPPGVDSSSAFVSRSNAFQINPGVWSRYILRTGLTFSYREHGDGFNVASYYIRAPLSDLDADAVSFRITFGEYEPPPATVVTWEPQDGVDFIARDGRISQGASDTGVAASVTDLNADQWFLIQVFSYRPNSQYPFTQNNDYLAWGLELRPTSGSTLGRNLEFAYGSSGGAVYHLREFAPLVIAGQADFYLFPGPSTFMTPYEGELCVLEESEYGPQGANAAHILWQLLFEPAPHGAGLDSNCYDGGSFVTLGEALESEGFRSHSMVIQQGTSIMAAVENLCSEIGIVRYWDSVLGQWGVKLARAENPTVSFSEDLLSPDLPEFSKKHGRLTKNDLRFVYNRSDINYREDDVYIPLDSEAATSVERKELTSVKDRESAEAVASRLASIEHGRPSVLGLSGMRDSCLLRVGDVLDLGSLIGAEVLFRVIEVETNPTLIETQLTVVSEQYAGAPVAATALSGGSGSGSLLAPPETASLDLPDPDLIFRTWEVSGFLGEKLQFSTFRISDDSRTNSAALLTSPDNVTFTDETSISLTPSGLLVDDYPADYSEHLDPGVNSAPAIYKVEYGPLFKDQSDSMEGGTTTIDDIDWLAGRQLLLVNNEVMYVREFETLGDGLWKARGVLRARLETQRETHLIGDACFVLQSDKLNLYTVPHAGRGLDLFIKSIPFIEGRSTPPASVTAELIVPEGKGIRPLPLSNFRTSDWVNGWRSDKDLTFRWSYSNHDALTQRTGCGMQGFGEVTGTGGWDGTFIFTLVDTAVPGLVLYTGTVTEPEVTVDQSWLALASAGEPLAALVIAVDSNGEAGDRIQLDLEAI